MASLLEIFTIVETPRLTSNAGLCLVAPMKLAGWPIVGWCSVALLAMTAFLLAVNGTGEEGVRTLVRHSAQTSIVLFMAAYSASSLRALWRTGASKWLLANRRYLGVSFAVSHTIHLAALIALYQVAESFRSGLNAATLVGGGLAYVFLFAMAATSFDRAQAWLGRRPWKILHTTGMHYIWLIFFQSYLPRALITSPVYAPFVVLLLTGLGLRVAAWRRSRLRRLSLEF